MPLLPSAAGRRPTDRAWLTMGQHTLFGVLFAIGLGQTVVEGRLTAATAPFVVALAFAYLVQFAGVLQCRRAVWFVTVACLWVATVAQLPAFAWLVFALSLLALTDFGLLGGSAATVALTVVAIGALWPGASSPVAAIIGPLMGALVAIGISAGYRVVLNESAERGRLVEELNAAQSDLVALQDELATTQRESGALTERARPARDIHDTLAQGYSSILLLSRAGLARGGADADLLRQIETTAAENLVEARRVVNALAPAQLEDAPLPAAVTRLLARLEAEAKVAASLEVSGDPRLASTVVDVAVLRLVQGALANVRQHAGASKVVVSLAYELTGLLVDVVDDGVGFDPESMRPASEAGGFGLRAMRERLAAVGGTLSVESAPGEGTAIAAWVPLEGAA